MKNILQTILVCAACCALFSCDDDFTKSSEYAEKFVRNNPESPVSVYILRKYFVGGSGVPSRNEIEKAEQLVSIVYKAQPKNGQVARMSRYVKDAKNGVVGASLPKFAVKDVYGADVTDAKLKGRVAVVYTWANWNYESRTVRDRLSRMKSDYGDRLALLGVSLDAGIDDCKRSLRNDSTGTIFVCDQMMFNSPLMDIFGFGGVNENILYNAQGRIIERNLKAGDFESKLKTLLN